MKPPVHKAPGNYDPDAKEHKVRTINNEPSMTIQENADLHMTANIVARFLKTGQLPDAGANPPIAGDLTNEPTMQQRLDALAAGQHAFLALPEATRAAFNHDMSNLVRQVDEAGAEQDPDRRRHLITELRRKGMDIPLPPKPEPPKVTPAPPAPPPA